MDTRLPAWTGALILPTLLVGSFALGVWFGTLRSAYPALAEKPNATVTTPDGATFSVNPDSTIYYEGATVGGTSKQSASATSAGITSSSPEALKQQIENPSLSLSEIKGGGSSLDAKFGTAVGPALWLTGALVTGLGVGLFFFPALRSFALPTLIAGGTVLAVAALQPVLGVALSAIALALIVGLAAFLFLPSLRSAAKKAHDLVETRFALGTVVKTVDKLDADGSKFGPSPGSRIKEEINSTKDNATLARLDNVIDPLR